MTAPRVSVVMPVRDEERWIERSVRSVMAQRYPAEALEIVVVVGPSSDRTRDVVAELARHDPRIVLIDNEDGRTPVSLNRGIARATGVLVARVDGHGWIDRDYVQAGVDTLAASGLDAVGGVVRFTGEGATGRGIALAMNSRLGAGTAAFRSARLPTEADGLMWGMYRRELFDEIGGFDETLLRNQDDELCHRIRLAGGRMLVTPTMRFRQVARSSLRGLWSQYAQWGRFRVATLVKHRRPATRRQLLPAILVTGLGASVGTELATAGRCKTGRAAFAAYGAVAAISGLGVASGARQPHLAGHVAAAIATMQIAYGFGFWAAAAEWMKARYRPVDAVANIG